MADYQTIRSVGAGAQTAQIDAGLKAHMNKVYGLMSVGMLLTGGVAWGVGTSDTLFSILRNPDTGSMTILGWIAVFA
ncbi:MAG: BAX inhibitor (BI)-1/YccA family protein, partial [Pseudomonadota bacterium]